MDFLLFMFFVTLIVVGATVLFVIQLYRLIIKCHELFKGGVSLRSYAQYIFITNNPSSKRGYLKNIMSTWWRILTGRTLKDIANNVKSKNKPSNKHKEVSK